MIQSALKKSAALPRHVAVIMDGNGRWATAKGWPRRAGHAAGARAVTRIVEAARTLGIPMLTLYAFSADNWRRPAAEVRALMRIFARTLRTERLRCVHHGIRLSVIGERARLDARLRDAIDEAEQATARGTAMHLRIAVDYSARAALVSAAASAAASLPPGATLTREGFAELIARAMHADAAPDVDLLVRTGGEQRLSDFLLWECAYAELHFTPRLWPDVRAGDLVEALDAFAARERRFGALPETVAAPGVATA